MDSRGFLAGRIRSVEWTKESEPDPEPDPVSESDSAEEWLASEDASSDPLLEAASAVSSAASETRVDLGREDGLLLLAGRRLRYTIS